MRVASGTLLLVFVGLAASRWSDAATLVWALIYGYAAVLALMALLGVDVVLPALAGAAGYAAAVVRLPGAAGLDAPGATAGLALCAVWSAALVVEGATRRWRQSRAEARRAAAAAALASKASAQFSTRP